MTFANPVTGTPERMDLAYGHLALALRLMAYAPETAALIPLLLDQARRDQLAPVASQAYGFLQQLEQALNYGMQYAVICTEDVPFYHRNPVDMDALRRTYLGSEQYDMLKNVCDRWPAGVLDEDFHAPFNSQVSSTHPFGRTGSHYAAHLR